MWIAVNAQVVRRYFVKPLIVPDCLVCPYSMIIDGGCQTLLYNYTS